MSRFDTIHPRRGTGSLKWDRRPDLDPFWVADMDFTSPPEVLEAIQQRVKHGIFGYAVPHQGLYEALQAYLLRAHDYEAKEDEIVHLGGLVPALSLATKAFAKAGDALMTCMPVYPPFLGVHRDGDLELKAIDHTLSGKDQWTFDWEAMEAAVTPNTKLFILCNPQNPLGRVFSREEVIQLAEFCKRHNLILISDEIHCDLVLDPEATPHFSVLRLPEDLRQRCVTLLAPSKTYNIAGLGYSYAVIPNDSLRRQFNNAKGHLLPEINCLSYYAAEAAYQHGESWRQELIVYLQKNRNTLVDFIQQELPLVVVPKIEATYLAWMDCRALKLDHPATQVEKQASLFLSDGAFFGSPGHLRLNYGCSHTRLLEGLEKLKKGLLPS